jgi:RNA polymerase sigma-70 factor, ECF subfamily
MGTLHSGGTMVGTSRALPTAQQQCLLAERIRRHEPAAEEELVRLFRDRILVLVRMRTHDAGMAQDLTQEVLLAVMLALRDGQLREPERLAAFVYGTARNVVNNHLRSHRSQPREDPIDPERHTISSSDPVEDAERSALVRSALSTLEPRDRKILLLTLVNGLKPGEIAARIGLTSEVVRARKSRALKKLIERVKKLSRR